MNQQTFLRDIISDELVELVQVCSDDLYNYGLYENMPIKSNFNNSTKNYISVVLFENDDIYIIDEGACPVIRIMYRDWITYKYKDMKYTIYTDKPSVGYDEYIVIVDSNLNISYLTNFDGEVNKAVRDRSRLNYNIQISEEFSEQKPILENILDRYMEYIGKL